MKASSTRKVLAVNCPTPPAMALAALVMVAVAGKAGFSGSRSSGRPRASAIARRCSSQPVRRVWYSGACTARLSAASLSARNNRKKVKPTTENRIRTASAPGTPRRCIQVRGGAQMMARKAAIKNGVRIWLTVLSPPSTITIAAAPSSQCQVVKPSIPNPRFPTTAVPLKAHGPPSVKATRAENRFKPLATYTKP